MTICAFWVFFFLLYGHHRDLHGLNLSFPPARCSDVPGLVRGGLATGGAGLAAGMEAAGAALGAATAGLGISRGLRRRMASSESGVASRSGTAWPARS